ncbi:MAG: class I adenylate-forming enzyme family protein [Pseudonocardiales bacterium]
MLLEAFLDVAKRRADALAIETVKGDGVTYGELSTEVEHVAGGLMDLGVRPGQVIATRLDNSIAYVATILALAGVGAVHLPISLRSGSERAASLVDDVQPQLVISAGGVTPVVGAPRCVAPGQLRGKHRVAANRPRHDDIFRMQETSGSTGEPRLARWRQDAMVAEIEHWMSYTATTEQDVFFNVHPLDGGHAVDLHVLPALLSGAKLVLGDIERPAETLIALSQYRATVFSALPRQYDLLTRAASTVKVDLLPDLRLPLCGGAYLMSRIVRDAHEQLGVHLRRIYGSTEFGMVLANMADTLQIDDGMVPVGDVQVQLKSIDPARPTVGEIVAHSSHMGAGYFGADPQQMFENGWYRTGDVAELDEYGRYHVLGRTGDAISTGQGLVFAPYLEETLTMRCPVTEVAVLVTEDVAQDRAALVVAEASTKHDHCDVAARLAAILAVHDVCAKVHVVSQMPHTPTGKPDKPKIRRLYSGHDV